MGDASGLVTSICGGVGVILGAWALVLKAKSTDNRAVHLLQRLWDWIEGNSLDSKVPRGLRTAVMTVLSPPNETGGDDA